MNSLPPLVPPVVDMKDPRIRVTFPDVAMRIAHDGPMYAVIILVGILAIRGTIHGIESVVGAALALQARSRPPDHDNKRSLLNWAPLVVVAGAMSVAACV